METLLTALIAFSLPWTSPKDETPKEEMPVKKEQKLEILLDKDLSPKAAAPSLVSLHEGLEAALDRYYNPEEIPINSKLLRFTEMTFGWIPLNYMTMVTQHEVFGHGYRVRDLGPDLAKVHKYTISPPLPYGLGGGATSYFTSDQFGPVHQALITAGGVEGTSILAQELKTKWFKEGKIDPRQANTYIQAFQDPTLYALTMRSGHSIRKGHDMETYHHLIRRINPSANLTTNQLKLMSIINLLDPMTYYSAKSIWHYISTGESLPLPETLWNARLGYAPYGPESYIEHHRMLNGKPMYAYIKGGKFGIHRYCGCGFEQRNLWEKGPHTIGLRADAWIHPILDFRMPRGYSSQSLIDEEREMSSYGLVNRGNQLGGSFTGTYNLEVSDTAGLELQLGAKTSGYLPGESINAAPIFRAAFNFKF